ncbi:rod shape-determining protein MreD [Kiloniella laminariae]|uniref:rod shape-determining protein MreD n=1 Tax=Kiloniella laminariae TaxID=454162 RepID=UPI0003638016|nr:rod shape-determining protein MreD [Kiloniella laminariae]
MSPSFWQRIDGVARAACPFTISLLLIILALVPLQIPHLATIMPSLLLISVFYWSLYRPDLMPVWAVFVLAVIQDLLSGSLLGVVPFILLFFCIALNGQRRLLVHASFLMLWISFSVLSSLALALQWCLIFILETGTPDYRPVLFQSLTTIAVYPAFSWMFVLIQRSLLKG